MPTYEYVCPACGFEFEAFQAITDGALRKCPQCKRLKLKRLIGSGAGIIFRGSGFYETDYRSQSYKDGERKESGTAASSSSSAPSTKSSAASKNNGSQPAGKSADKSSETQPAPKDKSRKAS